MRTQDNDLICYVIMRTDLDSLNPGKAMAQAHHAYGALKVHVRQQSNNWSKSYIQWQDQTKQDFGTVIVLSGSLIEIDIALQDIENLNLPLLAGWVLDPTYPVRDGQVTHLIPLYTCAYVFGERSACTAITDRFTLHP